MKITLTPMRRDDRLTLWRDGDVLTVNGESLDFGPLKEGELLPRDAVDCAWIASDVERRGGEICLALILPHGADAPVQTRHPAPLHLTEDGPVALPPYELTGADHVED